MEKDKTFKSNFIWNIIGTTFNAFNSLFFMIVVTRVNGLDAAGIFTLAFSTACILYMVGIYAGRIYQVTEVDKSISDKDYIVNRVISCFMVVIFAILFIVYRKYDMYKSLIFLSLSIYKALEAFCEVLYGIMQKNNQLNKVGKSTFLKAILSLICFIAIDIITKNVLIASMSISIIYILIICFYDIKYVRVLIEKKEKINFKSVFSIFKNGFFTFAITFLGLYMTNAPKYTIDSFLSENLQAIFGIIIMPATVMGLLAQFLIHPYLNEITELNKNNNFKELKKILYKIILIILVFGAVCSIAGYLLGTPILGLLYGVDLQNYSIQLLQILIGATFYTMAGIISPILIAMRCTKSQFVVYLLISIIEYGICNLLVPVFELKGATLAYLSTMILYFVTFYIMSLKIIQKRNKLLNEGVK